MRSKGEAAAAPVSERGHYVRQLPLLRSARRSAMPPVSPTAGPSTPQPEQVDAYKSIRQVIAGPSVCPNAARQPSGDWAGSATARSARDAKGHRQHQRHSARHHRRFARGRLQFNRATIAGLAKASQRQRTRSSKPPTAPRWTSSASGSQMRAGERSQTDRLHPAE